MASELTIRTDIASRYWGQAALAELEQQYADQGFLVSRDVPIGPYRADLVARKGQKTEVIEVKTGRWDSEQRKMIARFRSFVVHELSAAFKLYLVNPPHQVPVEIEGLDGVLSRIWEEQIEFSALASLASQVVFEAVDDWEIDGLRVRPDEIRVRGTGLAVVELQYGSGDDGLATPDSYPFRFDLVLSPDLNVREILEWEVDTSSFYE